jgi:quercetin dioxygenase-like cupin family protein
LRKASRVLVNLADATTPDSIDERLKEYITMRRVYVTLVGLATVAMTLAAVGSAQEKKPADHGIFSPDAIQWQPGPPSLAPGARAAVLEGDPTREGIFTMRLSFPDGFEVKPHWHPATERVTVITGMLNLGMGDTFDRAKTKPLSAGSFVFMPPKMHHFAWAKGDTILQLTGQGPWTVNYLNPGDDPRKLQQ